MRTRLARIWRRLTLAQQFMLAGLVVLLGGMLGMGWWVGQQIEAGVVQRTAAATALYVDSLVGPQLQELEERGSLTAEQERRLTWLLRGTPLGREIAAFKVWDRDGRVVYSTAEFNPEQRFPVHESLASAWQGEVSAEISPLTEEENASERERWDRLLEIYSPVRLQESDQIVAVAEFYYDVADLEREIAAAQRGSWLAVGLATLATYLLLAGIVRRGSDTIDRQRSELSEKVLILSGLLAQNQELNDRVRRAATRTTELNERYLRRISAELHDGPAQDLSLALLRLEGAQTRLADCLHGCPQRPGAEEDGDLDVVQFSLAHALQEIRTISAGLRLPELEDLTPAGVVSRVVRTHERRTGSRVGTELKSLPEDAPLSTKIALYRLVQEALSNAYRHGGGSDQRVLARQEGARLLVEVSDSGQGFDWASVRRRDGHLGLVGMRERVESLGGSFEVESVVGTGTTVRAILPSRPAEPGLGDGFPGDEG